MKSLLTAQNFGVYTIAKPNKVPRISKAQGKEFTALSNRRRTALDLDQSQRW